MVKEDLANKNCKVNGETVKASSELSPPKKSLGKAQPMFYRVRAAAKGRETNLESSWVTIQISHYAKIGSLGCRELGERYGLEGEGRPNQGWKTYPEIMKRGLYRF